MLKRTGFEPTTTSTCCDVSTVLCQLSYEVNWELIIYIYKVLLIATKPTFPNNCSKCEKLINDVAEKEKNRLACFSSLSCVITALFDLPWEIMISFNYYTS